MSTSTPFPGDAGESVTHVPNEVGANLPPDTLTTPDMQVTLGAQYLDTNEDRHGRTVNVVAIDADKGRVQVQVIAYPKREKYVGRSNWISLKSLRDGYTKI
jgi:hypothetical protein